MKKYIGSVCVLLTIFIALIACGPEKEAANEILKSKSSKLSTDYPFVADLQFPLDDFESKRDGYQHEKPLTKGGDVYHAGIDKIVPPLTKVYAIANGKIVLRKTGSQGYRNILVIEHKIRDGTFFTSIYGHLSNRPGYRMKGNGEVVMKGDLIGYIGFDDENGTGGPHLHFAIKKGRFDGRYDGHIKDLGYIQNSYHHPVYFIKDRMGKGPIPQDAINAINNRLKSLQYSPRGNEGIHWYGGYHGKVVIQDIKLSGGCDAAVVYDFEGGANKAYLIKCGMWGYWAGKAGPASQVGMPITEEYGHWVTENGKRFHTIYQDFKNAYLTWRSSDGRIDLRYYRRATPGKFLGGRWLGSISYAFAEKYQALNGRLGVGDAEGPNNGTPELHKWGEYFTQDFDHGKWGWVVLIKQIKSDKVSMIRSGFWYKFRTLGLLDELGAPNGDEYHRNNNPDIPLQDFHHGYMQFDYGKFTACYWDGRSACSQCGKCNRSPNVICVPNQKECLDANTETTCYADGHGRTKRFCKYGCSSNRCNICKPYNTWCKSISIQEMCAADGKSFVNRECIDRCDNGRCNYQLPCIPNQTVCINSGEQITCSSDGKQWKKQSCAFGCQKYSCNKCHPFLRRCVNEKVLETCPNGTGIVRTECKKQCISGLCSEVRSSTPPKPQICKPGEVQCQNNSVIICSADGTAWNESEKCNNGCSSGKCNAPPSTTTCVPDTRVCHQNREVLQCKTDGSSWVHQYSCSSGCGSKDCKNRMYNCTITFDYNTRKLKITWNSSRDTYFVTWCHDMSQSKCWHIHHKTDSTELIIPRYHNFFQVIERKTGKWLGTEIRACKIDSTVTKWLEKPTGGCFEIQ